MREVIAVVAMMALAAGAGYAARDMRRDGPDAGQTCLPNADWMCADVRLDGFALPLHPYCIEYVHKSRALPKAKAGNGE